LARQAQSSLVPSCSVFILTRTPSTVSQLAKLIWRKKTRDTPGCSKLSTPGFSHLRFLLGHVTCRVTDRAIILGAAYLAYLPHEPNNLLRSRLLRPINKPRSNLFLKRTTLNFLFKIVCVIRVICFIDMKIFVFSVRKVDNN